MESWRIVLILLCGLLPPVELSSPELWLTSPVTCYILDGFLIIYSLIITALFFREKVLSYRHQPVVVQDDDDDDDAGDYQLLQMTEQVDAYQVLEPTKRKRNAKRKNRQREGAGAAAESTPAEDRARPLSPH